MQLDQRTHCGALIVNQGYDNLKILRTIHGGDMSKTYSSVCKLQDHSICRLLMADWVHINVQGHITVKVACRFISEENKSGGCTQLSKEGISHSCSASERKPPWGALSIDQVQYSGIDKNFSGCLGKTTISI